MPILLTEQIGIAEWKKEGKSICEWEKNEKCFMDSKKKHKNPKCFLKLVFTIKTQEFCTTNCGEDEEGGKWEGRD